MSKPLLVTSPPFQEYLTTIKYFFDLLPLETSFFDDGSFDIKPFEKESFIHQEIIYLLPPAHLSPATALLWCEITSRHLSSALGNNEMILIAPHLPFSRTSIALEQSLRSLKQSGISKTITVDAHHLRKESSLIKSQDIPDMINLVPDAAFYEMIKKDNPERVCLITPDQGAFSLAERVKEHLLASNIDTVVLEGLKKRSADGSCTIDFKTMCLPYKHSYIIDDIVDSGKTLRAVLKNLQAHEGLQAQGFEDPQILVSHKIKPQAEDLEKKIQSLNIGDVLFQYFKRPLSANPL